MQPRRAALWRGVEAQHLVSTMRLVDSAADQQVLEQLIEASRLPLPAGAEEQHDLLATPFRLRPPHESRFRRAATPGLWYGAETLRTACAEVGYWRWRFLRDSQAFDADAALHTQHMFYRAQVAGSAIDLTKPPWNASAALWRHPSRYNACQRLAAAAAEYAVAWIRYASAREPRDISRRSALAGQVDLLRTQRLKVAQEVQAQREQIVQATQSLKHHREVLATNRGLQQDGFVSPTRVSQLEATVADYGVKVEERRSELARAEQRLVDSDLRIRSLESEYRQQARDQLKITLTRLSDFQQEQRMTSDAGKRQVIVAPASGDVIDLKFTAPGA